MEKSCFVSCNTVTVWLMLIVNLLKQQHQKTFDVNEKSDLNSLIDFFQYFISV